MTGGYLAAYEDLARRLDELPAVVRVPSHAEIAALAGAVREGDLSPEQCELLAQLVVQVGTAARAPEYGLQYVTVAEGLAAIWQPALNAYAELLETLS